MKLLTKLMILSIGGVIASTYIKGPDGAPLFSFSGLIPKDAASIVNKVSDLKDGSAAETSDSGKQIFYKWKDENGVWQMTQFKPEHLPENKIEERVIYANANIIKSLDSTAIASTLKPSANPVKKFNYNPQTSSSNTNTNTKQQDAGKSESKDDKGLLTTVAVDKIPQMINDAKNLDATLQKRAETIEQYSRQ